MPGLRQKKSKLLNCHLISVKSKKCELTSPRTPTVLQVQLKHISFNRNNFTAERILPRLVGLGVFEVASAECLVTEIYQTKLRCSARLKVLGLQNLNGSKEEYYKAQQLRVPPGSWEAKEAHKVIFSRRNLNPVLQV